MAVVTPWKTSDDLIEMIKRKISFPTSQVTFSDDDLLKFVNEQMFIEEVPSVLQYHQEYFVTYIDYTLNPNQQRYPIPDRAIGMRLRDIFYLDTNNNLYEMTRINPEDKAWFQRDFNAAGRNAYPYFLENNDIVFPSTSISNPTGSIRVSFFIRPNQLVADLNAATIQSFSQNITINNADLNNLDNFEISTPPVNPNPLQQLILTAISSGIPVENEFLIGGSSSITATNFANLINTLSFNNIMALAVGNVVTLTYPLAGTSFSTNNITGGFIIPTTTIINFDNVPSNITNLSLIDFLQTKPGHKIQKYDIQIPANGVSGTSVLFNTTDIPNTLLVGDYICTANTAIIPYLPPDLHNVLAERACARILAAIGDLENLQLVNANLQQMENKQGTLIDSRVDGKPQKVSNKHTLIHYGGRSVIKRF